MLPGYHQIFNQHALQFMNRGVDVPDPILGIGFAEVLSPIQGKISYQNFNPPRVIQKKPTSIDDVSFDGQGQAMSPSQFPHGGYIGEWLGGF